MEGAGKLSYPTSVAYCIQPKTLSTTLLREPPHEKKVDDTVGSIRFCSIQFKSIQFIDRSRLIHSHPHERCNTTTHAGAIESPAGSHLQAVRLFAESSATERREHDRVAGIVHPANEGNKKTNQSNKRTPSKRPEIQQSSVTSGEENSIHNLTSRTEHCFLLSIITKFSTPRPETKPPRAAAHRAAALRPKCSTQTSSTHGIV